MANKNEQLIISGGTDLLGSAPIATEKNVSMLPGKESLDTSITNINQATQNPSNTGFTPEQQAQYNKTLAMFNKTPATTIAIFPD